MLRAWTPGKSRLGGPTAALSERLYRVGLEPATVAALTSKVSLGDLRDYQHDAEFWQQLGEVLTTGGAPTMRAELIGHFQPCMTDIYLHIVRAHLLRSLQAHLQW